MGDTTAAAEAALAAALADVPSDPIEGDVLDQPGAALEEREPAGDVTLCTEDEARQLVTQAREAIVTLDRTMEEIIRRRAWLALGYETPRDFWVKEFGGTTGMSRQHVYRTARVLSLLYNLVERLGDDAAALAITERSLRALPSGDDVALIERIADQVDRLGDSVSVADIQQVVDTELSEARQAAKQKADSEPVDVAALARQLKDMGMDPSALLDPIPNEDTDPWLDGDTSGSGQEAVGGPEWTPAAAAGGSTPLADASRSGVSIDTRAVAAGPLAPGGGSHAIDQVTLTRAIGMIEAVSGNLEVTLAEMPESAVADLRPKAVLLRTVADLIVNTEGVEDDLEELEGLDLF